MILALLVVIIVSLFILRQKTKQAKVEPFPKHWHTLLASEVDFYNRLKPDDQQRFRLDMMKFLASVEIIGVDTPVEDLDRVFIASAATMMLFGFKQWSLSNLTTVLLYSGPVNLRFEVGKPDSRFAGFVGNGHMTDQMALSKPHLHRGFASSNDRRNVAIHEFAHLVDGLDGSIAGFPAGSIGENLLEPWVELVRIKSLDIKKKESDIRPYALTNAAEFFAVVSEYFFEAPEQLKSKHPAIYEFMSDSYDLDPTQILKQGSKKKIRANSDCPCGSGEKFKVCCQPMNQG
jgi:Mlc titration factor MtfA (ptsG expression regulator)